MKIIINADDFGVSPQVNRAIYKAAKEKYITSCTLLAASEHLDEAIEMSKEMSEISLGVHLAFTKGPTGEPLYFNRNDSLNPRGANFLKLNILIDEFTRQIETLLEKGVQPTHIDTHHHIHLYPLPLMASIVVAKRYGIKCIRSQKLYGSKSLMKSLYRLFHHAFVRSARMIQPDCYSDLKTFFHSKPENKPNTFVHEIMCHPGGKNANDEIYFNDEFFSPIRHKLISYRELEKIKSR